MRREAEKTNNSVLMGLMIVVVLMGGRAEARLAVNRLEPEHLVAERSSAVTLAADKLVGQKLDRNTCTALIGASLVCYTLNRQGIGDLLTPGAGQDVLTYILSCAAPYGTYFVDQPSGYSAFGDLGLAPQWLTGPLDKDGKGWMSACLFARTNETDLPVPISIRGPNPALALDPAGEAASFPHEQGAFYGNYFTSAGEEIACSGKDEAVAENHNRDCAGQDPTQPALTKCGFTYAGACGDFAPAFACKDQSKYGAYQSCFDQASCTLHDQHPMCKSGLQEHQQVITVFVQ